MAGGKEPETRPQHDCRRRAVSSEAELREVCETAAMLKPLARKFISRVRELPPPPPPPVASE